jgi:L-ascorbate metabolism protein UlaG (beta-lactamase superfamily)
MQQAPFGQLPKGDYLMLIKNSKNYQDKSFKNRSVTPDLTEGVSYWNVTKEFIFKESKRVKPAQMLPSKKTDLTQIALDENVLVWFGHSSYFIQVDGKKILVDPVLSGNASPVSFTTKSFAGADVYTHQDFPEIDYVFISHDHWDHLDYKTIMNLKSKIKHIVCGLGVKVHLLRWGFSEYQITEKDWDESFELENGFHVNTTSARHFSGRGFKRNQSLWMSYVLTTPSKRIFIGGDSGYDAHFAEIGQQFGPFDWAILECGQYDKSWKYIHMQPEEVAKAAFELNAKMLLPVHWAKFALGNHDWDEPIIRVSKAAKKLGVPYKTPMIGELLQLDNPNQLTSEWWLGLK